MGLTLVSLSFSPDKLRPYFPELQDVGFLPTVGTRTGEWESLREPRKERFICTQPAYEPHLKHLRNGDYNLEIGCLPRTKGEIEARAHFEQIGLVME
jgi:hypothetical protein